MKISEGKKIIKKAVYLKRYLIILLGGVLIPLNVFSQTYALPDASLRSKLMTSYPSVMTGNLLDITAAGNLTGTLNLSSSNISNAEGIQYFTSISSLNLSNNKLEDLPDISGLTQLMYVYLGYNKLTTIPSLSSFPNLVDFQAPYNQLTILPSFAGNTNLMYIYCQNNKLTSLPDISLLTNLKVLDIGVNHFSQLPDLSSLVNLEELHVHRTDIDTIIGLSALSNLKVLYAWGNKIRDLSGLDANTALVTFQVFNNELYSLPVLSNKPSLVSASFINNRLTFEDILPLTSLPGFGSYAYNPQKSIPLSSDTVREKDNVTFNLLIDQGITTNLYTWYKDGDILTTNQTGIFSLNTAYKDSGSYQVQVTNPGLAGLSLQSDPANLHVKSCLEINSFITEYVSESCQDGSKIQLAELDLGGGMAPFSYGIVKVDKADTLFSSAPQFESLSPGMYSVVVRDFRMCKAEKNISVRNPVDCNIIISPNGDGIMDTYFIEEPGAIKIFDTGRNLVRELSSPVEWDGRKSDGIAVDDGYYAIVINEKKVIHVTVVK
jgi:internalin A